MLRAINSTEFNTLWSGSALKKLFFDCFNIFVFLALIRTMYLFSSSDPSATSCNNASKAPENIEPPCEFCGHVGIHEVKCYDEKKKTKLPLNKRLDKNSRLKNFQHEHYARKRTTKGKIDAKGYQRDVKEHFVFGQNVTKSLPSEIADALFKRDANKYYNLQFPGNLTKVRN